MIPRSVGGASPVRGDRVVLRQTEAIPRAGVLLQLQIPLAPTRVPVGPGETQAASSNRTALPFRSLPERQAAPGLLPTGVRPSVQ